MEMTDLLQNNRFFAYLGDFISEIWDFSPLELMFLHSRPRGTSSCSQNKGISLHKLKFPSISSNVEHHSPNQVHLLSNSFSKILANHELHQILRNFEQLTTVMINKAFRIERKLEKANSSPYFKRNYFKCFEKVRFLSPFHFVPQQYSKSFYTDLKRTLVSCNI